MQNQLPCINPNKLIESYYRNDHGSCFAWWVAEKKTILSRIAPLSEQSENDCILFEM